ncbi:MAG: D-alanyl-D-alanine dipeptidase [Hyphomonadaceae bacterium]|nr:MAG: D-alanyl-D-alanine dipeptidase [Hyphomonadaceae bacterium]KAF0185008.1 MAG: D-alanyl-D-alanine dipeptidase [Hyphomonadaceae bacterium]
MQIRLFFAILVSLVSGIAVAQTLPDNFVYLREIDPRIVQDMRYASANNFMGRPLAGYQASECILKRETALALKNVQDGLVAKNQTLIVFDCYRPKMAVNDMVNWVNSGDETNFRYYPKTSRAHLIELGYISATSNHSRGYTVDLAIGPKRAPWFTFGRQNVCGNRKDRRTFDFGTPFDCFDIAANTAHPNISAHARRNRQHLVEIMQNAGFRNLPDEWWHFTLNTQPQGAPMYEFEAR